MNRKNKKKSNSSLINFSTKVVYFYVCTGRRSLLTGNPDYIQLKVGKSDNPDLLVRLRSLVGQVGGTPIPLFAIKGELTKRTPNESGEEMTTDYVEKRIREFYRKSFVTGSEIGNLQGGIPCIGDAEECIDVPWRELVDPILSNNLISRFINECLNFSKEESKYYDMRFSIHHPYTKGTRGLLKIAIRHIQDEDLSINTQVKYWLDFKRVYDEILPIEIKKQIRRENKIKTNEDIINTVKYITESEKQIKDAINSISSIDCPTINQERQRAGNRCLYPYFRVGQSLYWAELSLNSKTGKKEVIQSIEVVVVDPKKNLIKPRDVNKFGDFTGTPTKFTETFISEETKRLHTKNTWEGFRYLYVDSGFLNRLDMILQTT